MSSTVNGLNSKRPTQIMKPKSRKNGWLWFFYAIGLFPTAIALIQVGANMSKDPANNVGLLILPIGTSVSFMCGKAIGNAQKVSH
jgi:hypothetical protein